MRGLVAIARKELTLYFTTPVAWVVLMVMAFFAAQFFTGAVEAYRAFTARLGAFDGQQVANLDLTDVVVTRLFASVSVLLVIAAPFLSMRLLAEEKRDHTFELLMTTPVRPWEIVAGKYLAALVVLLAAVAVVGVFPALLSLFARGVRGGPAVEWPTVASGLLGLSLLGAMGLAVGLFVSALTGSVVVAALVSLVILLGLWVATLFAVGAAPPVRELAAGLSSSEHLLPFLQGRIELRDVAYYLSFVVLGLFLAGRAVEGHRWA